MLDSLTRHTSRPRHIHHRQAITLYLSREHGLKKTENAEFKLMAIGQEKYSGYSWCRTYGSTSDELKQYSIATSITENEWIEVLPLVA